MEEKDKRFLGKGWGFPPVFDPHTANIELVEEEEDIRQSLIILISTIPGERVMQPLFGCDIHSMVFKNINTNTITQIKDMISMAIIRYEPRIDVENIEAVRNEYERQRLDIKIIYTVRTTNIRTNIVYPFYFIEGTDLKDSKSL
jgi:phage baseplate assembly protein W